MSDFPFFLLGHDRSGTTMLRLILDRGAVAVPPESMFLLDVDPEQPADEVLRAAWNHPRVQLWGLAGEPPALPAGLNGMDAFRFAVSAPFVAYAEREGKGRWGDKTPAYIGHVDRLAAIWPDARFVHLIRDGRDVALSVMDVPFGPNNAWAAGRSWARAMRQGHKAAERYPGRVLEVRYEDLVSKPAETVAALCDFLGLDYSDDMLAIEQTDRSKVVADQSAWFTNVWSGITTAAVGKWRTELTPRQIETFEAVAGDELRALGYETSDGAAAPALVPAYAAHDAAMRGVNFVRLRLVQERGRELRHVLRRKLAR
ncbi:MAG: sulfotransferase family protein [Gaiellaceae bacterium]